jgi:tetratricopeptide (TPR) repeat protein
MPDQFPVILKGVSLRSALLVLSVVSIILGLSGCAVKRFPVVRPVKEQPQNIYSRKKAQQHFIRARDYDRRGLGKMAEREYERALQFDPKSEVLKDLVIKKYIESGKFTQALLLVKQGKKNEKLTRDQKRAAAGIYLKMGEIARAAWMLESIKKKTNEELSSLGLIYESLGNVEKALGYYWTFLKKNPDALQVGFKVAKILLQEKKYREADSLLSVMQQNNGPQPDLFVLRGSVALSMDDTAKALAVYDSALMIDTLHEGALRSKAQVFIARSDFPQAIDCYSRLMSANSYGEVYGRTLSLLYYYNKQYDEAETLLKKLLRTSMDDFELHYYLGLVFAATEKDNLARTEFEKSLALQNNNKDAWRELINIFIRRKEYGEALAVVSRYTEALPDEAHAWRMRGYIESLRKAYSDAITVFRKALEIDSLDAFTWFELGSSFERNNQIDSAVTVFEKVLKLRPDDPSTLNYLGYMWAEKGINLDTAKIFLEKALEKDPENGAFLDSYAWVYYQLGEYDSAQTYIDSALAKINDDPILYHHLGDILMKQDKYDSALPAYRKSIELGAEDAPIIRQKIIDIEIIIQQQQLQ